MQMKTGPTGVRDPRGILDALAVALGGEVEAAEAVAREGVRPALEHHRPGLVGPARADTGENDGWEQDLSQAPA